MEAEIVTIGKVAAETNEFWHLQAHAAFASAKQAREELFVDDRAQGQRSDEQRTGQPDDVVSAVLGKTEREGMK